MAELLDMGRPGKDDGYSIPNCYGVDPRDGTLGDFVEFTHGRQQRCIRVIHQLRRSPDAFDRKHERSRRYRPSQCTIDRTTGLSRC
jgi:hypothetical protein